MEVALLSPMVWYGWLRCCAGWVKPPIARRSRTKHGLQPRCNKAWAPSGGTAGHQRGIGETRFPARRRKSAPDGAARPMRSGGRPSGYSPAARADVAQQARHARYRAKQTSIVGLSGLGIAAL